jgi:hypothetical protein
MIFENGSVLLAEKICYTDDKRKTFPVALLFSIVNPNLVLAKSMRIDQLQLNFRQQKRFVTQLIPPFSPLP